LSAGNPERFPWGSNDPSPRSRWTVAVLVAILCTFVLYIAFVQHPARHTDFTNAWFGARMLVQGRDPYPLLGPGRVFQMDYPLLYPGSSLVLVLPFAFLSDHAASLVFLAVSTLFMVYGITQGGWHRLPMLVSAAFFDSVMASQWTIILTAVIFLPWLAFVAPAKPQTSLPVLGSTKSALALYLAAASAILLLATSLWMLPGWPAEWLANIRAANVLRTPIFSPVGFLTVAVLARWRIPEAWLVLLAACLPQTFMWYSSLVLLATARTYRESALLSMTSTVGFLVATYIMNSDPSHTARLVWTIYLSTTFLPATIVILMRPNRGPLPAWMRVLRIPDRDDAVS
jgi:hypothetical protein